ncbi:hypothetical protein VN0510_00010 [Helicobacter pylori]
MQLDEDLEFVTKDKNNKRYKRTRRSQNKQMARHNISVKSKSRLAYAQKDKKPQISVLRDFF